MKVGDCYIKVGTGDVAIITEVQDGYCERELYNVENGVFYFRNKESDIDSCMGFNLRYITREKFEKCKKRILIERL